jgi:hypothetical protein
MNSFPDWLKVVLAVVVLALLAGSVFFHRVRQRLVRQDAESNLKAIAKLKASRFLSNGVKREL